MKAKTSLALLMAICIASSCGGSSDSEPATPTAPPASIVAPTVPANSAISLVLGDSQAVDCCVAFADFLSTRLNRPVESVNLAADASTVDFIVGVGGKKPSQVDKAAAAIQQYEATGHSVVAITLSLGRKDYQAQLENCPSPTDDTCFAAFRSEFLTPFEEQLDLIYSRIGQSAIAAPVLALGYFYDPSCPLTRDGTRSLDDVNRVVSQSATDHNAVFVDLTEVEGGCDSLAQSRPTGEGLSAIETRLELAYQGLPSPFVEPFVSTKTPVQ